MAFYLYVNGSRVHDESTGGELRFNSLSEGEAFADALFAKQKTEAVGLGHRRLPPRTAYVVASEPPAVD